MGGAPSQLWEMDVPNKRIGFGEVRVGVATKIKKMV